MDFGEVALLVVRLGGATFWDRAEGDETNGKHGDFVVNKTWEKLWFNWGHGDTYVDFMGFS